MGDGVVMETVAAEGIGSKYVQMTRDDIEAWLDSIGFRSKWRLAEGRTGIYLLNLSPYVAIKFSSTVASTEAVVGYANASMHLSLVSLVNGQTLNKKAQGQDHFKRTINWKKTWKDGIDRVREAYLKASDFYDNIAQVEDRDKYRAEKLGLIESIPNWKGNSFLMDLHAKVDRGMVLSPKQLAAVEKIAEAPRTPPTSATTPGHPSVSPRDDSGENEGTDRDTDPEREESEMSSRLNHQKILDAKLERLRMVWKAANNKGDTWTTAFVQSIAEQIKRGRPLSPKQVGILKVKLDAYLGHSKAPNDPDWG